MKKPNKPNFDRFRQLEMKQQKLKQVKGGDDTIIEDVVDF